MAIISITAPPLKDIHIPSTEDWDAEIEVDPNPPGRLRLINEQYVFMKDHEYEAMLEAKEKDQ